MTIRFAIVKDGGFAAHCPYRGIAAYAYPNGYRDHLVDKLRAVGALDGEG